MAKLASVILAAGQGTRMKSVLPKVLHELGGEPLVSYPIRLSLEFGASPISVVVGHGAEQVQGAVEAAFGSGIRFQTQREQLGTGHAVIEGMKALKGFKGWVLILYGDVPSLQATTIRKMLKLAKDKKSSPDVVAVTLIVDNPPAYGRIVRNKKGRVVKVVEDKDCTPAQKKITELNAGIYCAKANFLRKALKRLKNNNAQGEYYLTDVIEMAAKAGGVETVVATPEEVLGANNRVQIAELEAGLRERINRRHMLAGVAIIDPETTYISETAEIGADTTLYPGVHIRGNTKIGSFCKVDVGSVITDSTIHDKVVIRPYSIIDEAEVHNEAIIGPFARLRPGADIQDRAHVGNFVELKKTTLGKGAKANHLAYLGDSKIGANSNIGAGTITCNYDGFGKYLTDIGEGVFVGSNSTLVAPLHIGADAYIAAGSTVTKSSKADSLILGRARQVEKAGRASRIRQSAKEKADANKLKANGTSAPATSAPKTETKGRKTKAAKLTTHKTKSKTKAKAKAKTTTKAKRSAAKSKAKKGGVKKAASKNTKGATTKRPRAKQPR